MSIDRQNELPDEGFVAMLGELNVDPLEPRRTPTLECTIQIWIFLFTLRLVWMMTLVRNTTHNFQSRLVQSYNQMWTLGTNTACLEEFILCEPQITIGVKLLGTVFESKCFCNGHAEKRIQDRRWIALTATLAPGCLRLVDARHGCQTFKDNAQILVDGFHNKDSQTLIRFFHQVLRESEEVRNRVMVRMILFGVYARARWTLSTQETKLWMHEPLGDSLEKGCKDHESILQVHLFVIHGKTWNIIFGWACSWISCKFKRMALVYSRDSIARTLAQFSHALTETKQRTMDPDCARSGRLKANATPLEPVKLLLQSEFTKFAELGIAGQNVKTCQKGLGRRSSQKI